MLVCILASDTMCNGLQSPSQGFLIQATVTMIRRTFLKNSYLVIILKILCHWIWGKAWEPVCVCF